MRYWSKDNFEGLLDLAREFRNTPELAGLSEYCLLREKGLRQEALEGLQAFIDEASGWDVETSRRLVLAIVEADARTPAAHQFRTYLLLTGLIFPVLDAWLAEQPSAIEPLRWLGLLRNDGDVLRSALALDPTDIPVRRRLISLALDTADTSMHHLGESVLLLTVRKTRAAIDTARELIGSAPDPDAFSDYAAELDWYACVLADWVEYSKAPTGTFPEWCRERGREQSWPKDTYGEE